MAVSVAGGGASLTTGTPTVLFPFRPASATSGPTYAVTRNGGRFLLGAIVETDPKAPLSIVQNWTAGLSTTARYRR